MRLRSVISFGGFFWGERDSVGLLGPVGWVGLHINMFFFFCIAFSGYADNGRRCISVGSRCEIKVD